MGDTGLIQHRTLPYLSGRFFDGISSGLFMMALPWIMLQTPNMGTFVAMVALTCTLVSFVITPWFSTLIDRHSRKALLVINQVIQTSTAAFVFIAYWLDLGSHWLLAAAQLIFWVSSNLAWSTNNAFTQENFESHEYASISGKQEIIMQGTTLGAGALGVILLEAWSMLEFSAFAAIASALATFSYIASPYRRKLRSSQVLPFMAQLTQSRRIFSAHPRFYLFLTLSALSYPILTFLGKLVPIWFVEQGISGEWLAGYNLAFGLGSLVTGVFVTRLITMTTLDNTMTYATFIVSLTLVGMSFVTHPIYLLFFTLLFGFFNALNRIARTNWMHHTVAVEERGRADGGLAMIATMIQSMSYVLIAVLTHYGWTGYGFAIAAVIMLCATWVMWRLLAQPLSPKSETPQAHLATDTA